MRIEVVPLSNDIGAEVHGVDLSRPLDRATVEALRTAWHWHILLLFRDQDLTDADLKRSTDWLGPPGAITMPAERRGDDDYGIALISNIRDAAGVAIGALGDGDMWFHHDNCFDERPDIATFLYSVELPAEGGHTLFGNCYLAYEALPQRLKDAVAGRRVLQVYDYTVREKPDLSNLHALRHFWQPAVIVHPVTGKKALYVDRLMSQAISDYAEQESADFLEELFGYIERPAYEHVWRVGDYIVWDNRCSVHARTDFDPSARRLLKRGKVAGETLIAA